MDEIEQRFAADLARWRAREGAGAADAEGFQAFAERIGGFLEEVLARHPGEEVLIVAHGGTIRAIHALANGLDYVRDHRSIPAVDNCVPFQIRVQERQIGADRLSAGGGLHEQVQGRAGRDRVSSAASTRRAC